MEKTLDQRFRCEDENPSHPDKVTSVSEGRYCQLQSCLGSHLLKHPFHQSVTNGAQVSHLTFVDTPTSRIAFEDFHCNKQPKSSGNSHYSFKVSENSSEVPAQNPQSTLHHNPKLYFLATTLPLSRYPPRAYPPRLHTKAMGHSSASTKHTPTAHRGMLLRAPRHPTPRRQPAWPLTRHRGIQSLQVKSPYTAGNRATWNWLHQDAGVPFSKVFQATHFEFTYPMSSHRDARYGMLSRPPPSKVPDTTPYRILAPNLRLPVEVVDLTSPTFPEPLRGVHEGIGQTDKPRPTECNLTSNCQRDLGGFEAANIRDNEHNTFNFNDPLPPVDRALNTKAYPSIDSDSSGINNHAIQTTPSVSTSTTSSSNVSSIAFSDAAFTFAGPSASIDVASTSTTNHPLVAEPSTNGTESAEVPPLSDDIFTTDTFMQPQSYNAETEMRGIDLQHVTSSQDNMTGTSHFTQTMDFSTVGSASHETQNFTAFVPEAPGSSCMEQDLGALLADFLADQSDEDGLTSSMRMIAARPEAYLAQLGFGSSGENQLFMPESTTASTLDPTSSETSMPLTRVSTVTSTQTDDGTFAVEPVNTNPKRRLIVPDYELEAELAEYFQKHYGDGAGGDEQSNVQPQVDDAVPTPSSFINPSAVADFQASDTYEGIDFGLFLDS